MATIVDVAREAGVSISTVSHVVNGTRPVREPTRQRVIDAIARTGYTPNSSARALKRARTESIGLVVSDIENPFFTDVIGGVEAEAREAGYTLLLANAAEDPARQAEAIRVLHERRVDGLMVALAAGSDSEAIPHLSGLGLPVVLIDRLAADGLDQVGVENEAPTAELVRHLASVGHRRIAMVAGLPGISTTEERVRGYRLGLEQSGIEFDPALVCQGGSRPEQAEHAVMDVMSLDDRPTAFVSANNLMTLGVLRAIETLGLRVPEDVALVSYDDFSWADLFSPRLTTVAQPTEAIGREAMRLILRRLMNPDAPPRTVRLTARIVHRDSCGCSGLGLPSLERTDLE